MESRRGFVRATVAGAIGASIAGCLGDDGEEEYEDAIELLEENQETLDSFAEQDDVPDSFDEGQVIRRVERAEEFLDEAEEAGDDELADYVANARAVADYQRNAATYNALWVDLSACFSSVGVLLQSERWTDAATELDDCTETIDELRRTLDDADAARNEIDPDLLDDDGQLVLEDIDATLQREENALDAIEAFADGIDPLLSGLPTMFEGLTAYENEQWQSAETDFSSARDEFTASESTLAQLEDDPDLPPEMQADVIELRCIADSFSRAADHFASSAAAADRGDWEEAQRRSEEGEAALDEC